MNKLLYILHSPQLTRICIFCIRRNRLGYARPQAQDLGFAEADPAADVEVPSRSISIRLPVCLSIY